jgi:hypothetical protein
METNAYQNLKPSQQERFQALGVLPQNSPIDSALLEALWLLSTEEVKANIAIFTQANLLELDPNATKNHQTDLYRLPTALYSFTVMLFQTSTIHETIATRYETFLQNLLEQPDYFEPGRLEKAVYYQPHLLNWGETILDKLTSQPEGALGTAGQYVVFVMYIANGYLRLAGQIQYQNWDKADSYREIAKRYFEQIVPLCQTVGDTANEAEACFGIGQATDAHLAFDEATPVLDEATAYAFISDYEEADKRQHKQLLDEFAGTEPDKAIKKLFALLCFMADFDKEVASDKPAITKLKGYGEPAINFLSEQLNSPLPQRVLTATYLLNQLRA